MKSTLEASHACNLVVVVVRVARIGIDAIQIHGAVGYTWEYDPQLYLKRSKWSRAMYGDSNYHYDQIASMGGL